MATGLQKAGQVIKSLAPGAPGTKRWLERFGDRLVRVRYRGNAKRRVRTTTVEYKRLVMAGPLRWVVLSKGEAVTTFAFLVKVHYTVKGQGNVLFIRSDLSGDGRDDIFGVFSDNVALARYLRDEIFNYTVFAGPPGQGSPAPIVEATFESIGRVPLDTVEKMKAADGTTFTLSLREFDLPVAYIRRVRENLMEVGTCARPSRFSLEINGMTPVGEPRVGPLAEAPPIGGDLQNLWYLSEGDEITTTP